MVTDSSHEARDSAASTILAIDYGRARMGLAIADLPRPVARPLGTLERINRNEDMRRLRELARRHNVRQIVVGLPLLMDGTRGEMAEEAERFAQRVRKQLGVPVEMMDERLSSWEAERLLEEEFGRVSHRFEGRAPRAGQKKGEPVSVDSVAATVVMRDYLAQVAAQGKS